jgi:hypothetical protein
MTIIMRALVLLAIVLFAQVAFGRSVFGYDPAVTTDTWEEVENLTFWGVVSSDLPPEYSDILYAIRYELAKISIDLQIVMPDPSAVFVDTWDGANINISDYVLDKWDVPGDADGDEIWEYGVDGWDLTIGQVQLWNLNGLENLTVETPPSGYNVMPWMNDYANESYYLAKASSNPLEIEYYMHEWQEEFMHDPPMIIPYYPVGVANASVPLWMNLNNPFLSNRYVRQTIAHAIPYPYILNVILPAYGQTGIPGKTLIPPEWYEFHTVLPPYEYNLTKAQMYFDMWNYSQVGTDYTLGPVGDADFSGVVNFNDFAILSVNVGTTSADWTFLPGQDIDPDFNNDDYVGILGDVNVDLTVDLTDLSLFSSAYGSTLGDPNWNPNCDFNNDNTVDLLDLVILCQNYGETSIDFILWQENWGEEYPFPGAL